MAEAPGTTQNEMPLKGESSNEAALREETINGNSEKKEDKMELFSSPTSPFALLKQALVSTALNNTPSQRPLSYQRKR